MEIPSGFYEHPGSTEIPRESCENTLVILLDLYWNSVGNLEKSCRNNMEIQYHGENNTLGLYLGDLSATCRIVNQIS